MRANQLPTSSHRLMAWDKDECRFATAEEFNTSCHIYPWGTSIHELHQQCFGRYKILRYTGIDDIDGKPIYEGHIIEIVTKVCSKKHRYSGVVGSDRGSYVVFCADGMVAPLSSYDSNELTIRGNIFENASLLGGNA